jgi:hypothetical protein
MKKLSKVQLAFVNAVPLDAVITRHYSSRFGASYDVTDRDGESVFVGRLGKRCLTQATIDSLCKRGYVEQLASDQWFRTGKIEDSE